jgi:hypothetical protein
MAHLGEMTTMKRHSRAEIDAALGQAHEMTRRGQSQTAICKALGISVIQSRLHVPSRTKPSGVTPQLRVSSILAKAESGILGAIVLFHIGRAARIGE